MPTVQESTESSRDGFGSLSTGSFGLCDLTERSPEQHRADAIRTESSPQSPGSGPGNIALREALNKGISSGNFIDTKIILYSRKNSSGQVHRPRALYSNSHVLKQVPYFEDCERIAAFNILNEPHAVLAKCSSEISRSHSQKVLQT